MNIGLTLSGGGSRGFAHLGALKAMEELNLKPSIISGTSAGALVGALYAAGYSPTEISEIILKKSIFSKLKFEFTKFGLFSLVKVEKLLLEYIPDNYFEKLKIPLVVCAADIKRGEPEYFEMGELAKPVIASCAIPGIFSPVILNGKTYVDGGILNNLPIEPIHNRCDICIGVNVMPVEKRMPVSSAKDIMMKCLMLSIGEQSALKYSKFDVIIQPENIGHFNGLSLKNAQTMFDLGYRTAISKLQTSIELFT